VSSIVAYLMCIVCATRGLIANSKLWAWGRNANRLHRSRR